jgi:methylmalonyl-CoA/ethylmalonyl-CoA epimerase
MNPGYGLTFHHLGLAVEKPEPAMRFLAGLGYRVGTALYDPHQNVNLVWSEGDAMPPVELIFPADTPGPLDDILRRNKELIYHLCYVTGDLDSTLRRMSEAGHRVICAAPPKPAPLFHDERVSFYLVRGFGLIEIIEQRPGHPVAVRS